MAEFRLSPKYMNRFQRRILSTVAPLGLIAGAAGVWVSMAQSKSTAGLVFVIPVGLLCIGLGLRQGWRRQAELADSFRIRITDDHITREMLGVPAVSIARSDIKRIERDSSGGLIIHATGSNTSLGLPAEIEEYSTLLAELERWQPIEPGPHRGSQLRTIASALLVIALFAVTMLAKQRVLVTVCGIALAGILIACVIVVSRNQHVDIRLRRGMLFAIFPVLTILGRIFFLWSGKE